MKTNIQKNKNTEWKILPFFDLYILPSRNGLSKPSAVRGKGYKMVNMGELFKHDFIDDSTSMEYVPMTKIEISNSFLLNEDLLFARQSLVLSGVGKCVLFRGINSEITFESHIIRVRLDKKEASPIFYYYYFKSNLGHARVASNASMLAAAGIRGSDLQKIKVPVPPLPEQNRIVQVLETWDKTIEKLNKKIKIKKNIKKFLMSELLSGKKRLKGFDKKWSYINLGDSCKDIKTGKLDANAMIENGKYRFYTCAKDFYYINNFAFDNEALLVSGNGANVGYVHYYKGKFNAYQRTYVLYNFTQNIIFIKYLLDLFLKIRIKEEVRDGNTPYITMDTLTEMNLKIPEIKEQKAIAEILMKADEEISGLERKLVVIKKQKKYLLNNLITGKIRTPETLLIKI